jgi:CRP-like cAMP-binding protein
MDKSLLDYFKDKTAKGKIETVSYAKNEIILRPFVDTKYIYRINTGLVKAYTLDSRKKENIAVIYGSGDLFPLAWIIEADRPSVYFQTIAVCTMQLIPQKYFQEQLAKNNGLALEFMRHVVKQFALYASTLNNLGLRYGHERIAYRLLVLAARFGVEENNHIKIPRISHGDLAATVNMTRESTSRLVSRLKKMGIITYDLKEIKILDIEKLKAEVGKDVPVMFFDNI